MPRSLSLSTLLVTLLALLAVVPLLSVLLQLLQPSTGDVWAHLVRTVLPDYLANTAWIALGVALGTTVIGVSCAWLTATHEFPGRRLLEWALILPFAMPAYVMAYAYTDFLQVSGPLQSALRELTGWSVRDYWFPPIRSLGGAVTILVLALYPYVYLLARTAFLERSPAMLEAARTLGASPWRTFWRVSLPLARPAIAAGTALALMEALADYGTVAYFGIPTFTTGIFRTWYSLGDRVAAAQLASTLVGFVLLLLWLEQASRRRAKFDGGRAHAAAPRTRLVGWRAALAACVCALPVVLGFLLPAILLLAMSLQEPSVAVDPRFWRAAGNSLQLATMTALLAVVLALLFAYHARLKPSPLARLLNRLVGLGYALPGVVIAVGVLLPAAALDNLIATWLHQTFGLSPGLLLTGSLAGLVYAYLVRFLSTALHTVEAGLAKIPRAMDEAARTLGSGLWRTLACIHAPLLTKSLLTAALLVFVDVMKELPATLVMRPFNFDTLATRVHTLAADERLAELGLPSLTLVLVALGPVLLVARQITRHGQAPAPGKKPLRRVDPAPGAA
ncbi:iron ABC transporter permease [Tepidiphilus sp. J10]|uniref:ABC transporter permease n=1 Tax=Tepidiphilus sp. J10 TaxID=2502185 RepID=UPI00115EFFFC|nr:iron ABC transporter permease [Tepidiphilus sp. J10]